MENIHGGHRERLKNRFAENGLEGFTPVQVLELLLFYCIPRKDTNEIAHRLIERFGSLSQVLETNPEELAKVEGMGKAAATFLSLIPAVSRYYAVDKNNRVTVLRTTDECGNYLADYFVGKTTETVYLLCLNAACKVLCCQQVGQGGINSAGVSVRKVVETAIAGNATTVVIAHNHPSGFALPSNEDILTTKRIAAALEAVEITLADHLVVADGDYVSMVQSGYYSPGECDIAF